MYISTDSSVQDRQHGGAPPSLADDIRLVTRIFAQRWRMIGLCVAAALAAGIGYLWFATPAYLSTAELLIDPRPRQVVENDSAATGLGSSSLGADTALVESQVDIITSRSVSEALIERLGLLDDPEFGNQGGTPSFLSTLLKAIFYGPNVASQAPQSPRDRAMEKLGQALKVGRAGNTYVLQITAKTGAAEKSASIANAAAAVYLEQIQTAASDTSAETATFLEARLSELRSEADAAHQAVEDYRASNGLISADSLPVGEQQLRDITAQITEASIASEAARANLEEIRLLASAPPTSTSSNALSSPAIDNLRLQLEITRSEEVALAAALGPRHPSLIRARESRNSMEAALTTEYSRLVSQAESRYRAALASEQALRDLFADYKSRQASANAASIALEELERVASSKTAVYQTFLSRALEVREQVTSPASTARIISPAVASSRPSEPRLVLVLAIAFVAGLAVGFGAAWLHHLFGGTVEPDRAGLPDAQWREAERTAANLEISQSAPSSRNPRRGRPMAGLFR